jgi:hypothetical protein
LLVALAGASAIATGFGWFYALFGPFYRGSVQRAGAEGLVVTEHTESLFEHGLHPLAWGAFGLFAFCGLGLAISAVGIARRWGQDPSTGLLVVCAIVLFGMSWITGFSVGFFFLPGALLAMAALVIVAVSAEAPE